MRHFASALRIVGAVVALLLVAFVALTYQPVRHVLYNNTTDVIQTQQEHYGHIISPGHAADINGLFETPLSNRIVIGDKWMEPSISFTGGGAIRLRRPSNDDVTVNPPNAWARDRIVWREFRYQLNSDGSIVLLDSLSDFPALSVGPQPDGFPIHLAAPTSSPNPAPQRASASGRR